MRANAFTAIYSKPPPPALVTLPLGPSVTRNATWLAVGRVAGQLLSAVLAIVLARGLGTVGFGQYAFVGAIVLLANVFTTFGTDGLIIREIAGRREDPAALATRVVELQLLLSVGSVIVIVGGASLLPGRSAGTIAALRIYALSLFPLALYGVFAAALRGWERMDLYAQLTIATAALQTGAALAAVHVRASLAGVMAALTVAQLVAALLAWRLGRGARPEVAVLGRKGAAPLGPAVHRG